MTSVDRDGTGEGYDLELIKLVSNQVNIPVIAHGGVGRAMDVKDAIDRGADAVAMASILHYDVVKNGKLPSEIDSKEGNTVFLKTGSQLKKIISCSISDIKDTIIKAGYGCRTSKNDGQ